MRTMEERRHSDFVALAKARRIARSMGFSGEDVDRHAVRIRSNRCKCSCEMCRNPRRSSWGTVKGRLTLQELRVMELP